MSQGCRIKELYDWRAGKTALWFVYREIERNMAKRKASLTDQLPTNIDDCLRGILQEAKLKFGDDKVFTGEESESRLVGIYLPSLSLRYLYQSTILPLSRMLLINGVQESCKSAFLYEHFRWMRCAGGKSYLIESESKDSAALRESIIGYDKDAVDLFVSESLEDWQQYLTYLLRDDTLKAMLLGTKEKPGPGRAFPIAFGLDSLTAKASLEVQAKINEAGFADRGFPLDALKISSYLKCFPQKLMGWPFVFVATNHLKPKKTQTGAIEYASAGGFSVKFAESFETRMSRVADINTVDCQGALIKFVTAKNSLGPSRKSILAPLKWYFDKETGRQHSFWDWGYSTVELLCNQLKGSLRTAAHDIVDLHTVTAGGKKCWSNALNVPRSDPISYYEIALLLESRTELIDALHRLLGIRSYTIFKVGVDYTQQVERAATVVERAGGFAPSFQSGEAEENTEFMQDPDVTIEAE